MPHRCCPGRADPAIRDGAAPVHVRVRWREPPMGRGNPIPSDVRLGIDARDQRRCIRCGARSRGQHHRQRRREGGHGFENLVSLCNACHRWAHANPSDAREAGYIVSVHTDDIEQTPLLAYYGWVRLMSDRSIQWAAQSNGIAPEVP